jgi:hypothetical protein
MGDVADLPGFQALVFLGGTANGSPSFSETLVADCRVAIGRQFANYEVVIDFDARAAAEIQGLKWHVTQEVLELRALVGHGLSLPLQC